MLKEKKKKKKKKKKKRESDANDMTECELAVLFLLLTVLPSHTMFNKLWLRDILEYIKLARLS